MKAVITAAGSGSRWFPVAAVLNKAMLPVGAVPVLQHLVAELAGAGLTDIAVVLRPDDDLVPRYFSEDLDLRESFVRTGRLDRYEPVAAFHRSLRGLSLTWIRQQPAPYGSACALLAARDWIGDDVWMAVSSDDLVLRAEGNDLADLAAAAAAVPSSTAVQVVRVPPERVSACGIVEVRQAAGRLELERLIEKPEPGRTDSDLCFVSRMVLGPGFLGTLDQLPADPRTGEFVAAQAIDRYARDHVVAVHQLAGRHFDCGSVSGWLDANLAVRA
ncbi:UTP--glucose-1-phosphate uridylyltransferase GalU [Kribbella albertanoniae]|uniref:UTP--glucose-1-phosphate uridylyltransferase n=1 Tax=Kribbella albertanoniae TaxID=1266829 RepID=A0A4R4QIK9_9ACTN|nr:sugar phosphate nucleotidyltransferase [Kribbella albertanoniae]TDC35518.1 hypothetical protein E1261_01245 [Kribbella albertanoniae]